ncbi:hypothetical protein MMC22_008389 [Lobaria immixta]|nr:hypothetical protein [Lobaria immixta]
MPSPPPEYEIYRCPNYLKRDPPCQGWVKVQGVKCNNCIANGWSFTSVAPSAGALAKPDFFCLPQVQQHCPSEGFSSSDAAESAYSWCMVKDKPTHDTNILIGDMPQLIWQDISNPDVVTGWAGDAHHDSSEPHDLI